MNTIHLVTSTNNRYIMPCMVMLTSLLDNKVSKNPINIYIIDGGSISMANKNKIKAIESKYKVPIQFIRFNDSLLKKVNNKNGYSKEAFYRIFLPDLLDKKIDKALYLDSDLIVLEDISRLWEVDLKNQYIAAVHNPLSQKRHGIRRYLGIPEQNYFNSGVLLMNLKKWRKHGITKKILKFILKYPQKIRFADQDALNGILHEKWVRLNKKWNFPAFWYKPGMKPAILHFIGGNKPWSGNSKGKNLYIKYSKRIPG